MAEPLHPTTLTPAKKRDHEGQPILHNGSSTASSVSPAVRAGSPAISVASSSLTDLSTPPASNPPDANPNASPAKKRKLTFAEREVEKAVKKREKEEKELAKAEEKVRKDEEKRMKDEEKRKKAEERDEARRLKEVEKAEKDATRQAKEAERLEKKKAKDAEKAEKDAEKAKRETERLKKERAQMRLGTFFGRPATASSPPTLPDDVSSGVPSRRSSIASIEMEKPDLQVTSLQPSNPGYSKWILPFFTHDDTEVAPANRFLQHRVAVDAEEPVLDPRFPSEQIEPVTRRFGKAKRRHRKFRPVKEIVADIGNESDPIDLTKDGVGSLPQHLLSKIPYKILSYREDVRPPYQGTYTRTVSPRSTRKLSRRPTYRGLPAVDYDYDSEAEWQEPDADDEDLGDEDELSEDDEDGGEMADFLDDGEETAKRRVVASDAKTVSTGICWQGETEDIVCGIDLTAYRLDRMHDNQTLPIDPYSTNHWTMMTKSTPMKPKVDATRVDADLTPMQPPPRMPLTSLAPNASPLRAFVTTMTPADGTGQKENAVPPAVIAQQSKKSGKPVKPIPPDVLPAFKAAISGSDLNKVALIEILKKQFPKCSKDTIKGTLENVAERRGAKEADKRWILLD